MKAAASTVRSYFGGLIQAWDQFWFAPVDPAPLCAIRIATGLLLLWTHTVWTIDLVGFFGTDGWLPVEMVDRQHLGRISCGFFDLTQAPWAVWTIHVLSLIVFLLLTIGLFSRLMAVLGYLIALSYALHVTPGAFFGLDKINVMLVMYVMLGPCGARYSLDRMIRVRRGRAPAEADDVPRSWSANLALRLIQTHLCVIYLFGGLGKLQGDAWWTGEAIWMSVANVEYRSLDMTWMASEWGLRLGELLAHATVFFELFYCCLVWSRWTRPWVLLTALGVHGFIGLAMGMPEFATAMIVANAAFLPAGFVRGLCDPIFRRFGTPLESSSKQE